MRERKGLNDNEAQQVCMFSALTYLMYSLLSGLLCVKMLLEKPILVPRLFIKFKNVSPMNVLGTMLGEKPYNIEI